MEQSDLRSAAGSTISRSTKRIHRVGGFGIEILHPGDALGRVDSGLGTFGRIDDATIAPGTLVSMHPHRDDEILTYLRSGQVEHRDTVGDVERISATRLMLMNAGAVFEHEERVLPEGGTLRGLQIFARPAVAGLEAMVQFHDFIQAFADEGWRLVAGPDPDAPLRFRSASWVYDRRLAEGLQTSAPPEPLSGATRLLYIFSGKAKVGGPGLDVLLEAGEAVLLGGGSKSVTALETTDLVMFATDEKASCFKGGMFSGDVSRQTK